MQRFSKGSWRRPRIPKGRPTKFGWVVSHPKRFRLGKFTDIGYGAYIQSGGGVIIEDHVQIGGGVKIYSVDTIDNTKGKIVLKKNCKIGANSVLFPGVTVGENSVIGALSLVNRDIPPNVVACGVPAKVIKRMSTSEI